MVTLVKEINIKVYSNGTTETKEVNYTREPVLKLSTLPKPLYYLVLAVKILSVDHEFAHIVSKFVPFSEQMLDNNCKRFWDRLNIGLTELVNEEKIEKYTQEELNESADRLIHIGVLDKITDTQTKFAQLVVNILDSNGKDDRKGVAWLISHYCTFTGNDEDLGGILGVLYDGFPWEY